MGKWRVETCATEREGRHGGEYKGERERMKVKLEWYISYWEVMESS